MIDTGDTAFILAAAGLVLLMTPGLALFYGGMVRSKNVLGTILQSLIEWGQKEKDVILLTEYVRMSLRRYISYKYRRINGNRII